MEDRNAPVTRAELESVLDDRLRRSHNDLVERMRDMQTEIIRVSMEFQQRNETRDAAVETQLPPMTERMASIERRLLEIEKKPLLNPPAA